MNYINLALSDQIDHNLSFHDYILIYLLQMLKTSLAGICLMLASVRSISTTKLQETPELELA